MQDQFLEVIDRDEAERRFLAAIDCRPLGAEEVALDDALGRVLAADVVAAVDVPSFDRSNYDGYALRAADTYGAQEESRGGCDSSTRSWRRAWCRTAKVVAGHGDDDRHRRHAPPRRRCRGHGRAHRRGPATS